MNGAESVPAVQCKVVRCRLHSGCGVAQVVIVEECLFLLNLGHRPEVGMSKDDELQEQTWKSTNDTLVSLLGLRAYRMNLLAKTTQWKTVTLSC